MQDNLDPFLPPLGDAGFIYNVTTQVTWRIHEAWLTWMLDEHIPEIIGTGCFLRHQLVRVLETDETDGPIYAVQYYMQSMADYNSYTALYLSGFKAKENAKWHNKTFSFTSLMQVVR